MELRWIPVLALMAACGGDSPGTDAAPGPGAGGTGLAAEADAAVVVVPVMRSDPASARAYGPQFRTVKMRVSGPIRVAPNDKANKLGVGAANTRLAFGGSVPAGNGCAKRWIEIDFDPPGWVCEELVEPSRHWPDGIEIPFLGRAELVPGTYGKVSAKTGARTYTFKDGKLGPGRELAGSVNLRSYRTVVIEATPPGPAPEVPPPSGPRTYWDIGKGEVVAADQISQHSPSTFQGVRLGDESGLSLPIGFAVEPSDPERAVFSRDGRKLRARSAHPVLETERSADGKPTAYRISAHEWVAAKLMRVAQVMPPPDRTLPHERWFDIDSDLQMLVAYEGETPVYATLVLTGAKKWPTATGIFRNWIKFAETDMSGQMGDEAPYSVATVPWTQYFSNDLALHTSYWHNGFGTARSHGCVNLAPIDSRFLYFWSEPSVPPGWSMAHGHEQRPGSMVRVRSAADPSPQFSGYAKKVWEARGP